MSRDKGNPPSEWADATPVGGDVFVGAFGEGKNPIVWHWCETEGRWHGQGTGLHEVTENPLTFSPSLLWPCCGKHGFIRDGVWSAA